MLDAKTKIDNRWFGMPSNTTAANRLLGLAAEIGMKTLSSMYPNEFDYYLCALELTTSDDKTIDYLAFPINPDSISKTMPNRNSVKRSMGAVTVLSNPVFTPQEITISGSFGRGFKILTTKAPDPTVTNMSTVSGKYSLYSVSKENGLGSIRVDSFDLNAKTGYGVTKILEAIVDKSVALDAEGKPCKLYFYNMALGESYLVTISPSGLQLYQDLSKNMIWNYNLTLQIVSPIDGNKQLKKLATLNTIQNSVTMAVKWVDAFVKPLTSMQRTYGLTGF